MKMDHTKNHKKSHKNHIVTYAKLLTSGAFLMTLMKMILTRVSGGRTCNVENEQPNHDRHRGCSFM